MTAAVAMFAGSLLLSLISGAVLGQRIEQLGTRLGVTEAFLGILTALGADAPEISSAVTAIYRGQPDLGLAIVFGSNIFNLAMVLGLSAIVAGRVLVSRGTLALNGGVAVALSAMVVAQLVGWLTPPIAAGLIGLVFVPYVVVSALSPTRVEALGLPFAVAQSVAEVDRDVRRGEDLPRPTAFDVLTLAPSGVAVVVASVWMVDAATLLAAHWHISHAVVGMVVIAMLTSLPNVVSAIRLARRGRASAVVSEAFTSNSLNLIAGVSIPALSMTLVASGTARFAALWMAVMSVVAIGLASRREGLSRWGGAVLIAIYVAFLAVVLRSGGT